MTSPTDVSLTSRSDDDPEADEASSADASHDAPSHDGGPAGRAWLWIAWVLVVLLAGLLAWVWLGELRPLQQDEDRRAAVKSAAVNFLTQLTNWDAADGLGDTQDALIDLGTEGFATEVSSVFTAIDDLVAQEAESTATIEDLFVQSLEDETAVVFGVVEQTITTTVQEAPSVILRSFRARFVAADGRWLVQRMELVAEQQVSGGTPGVPSLDDGSEPTPSEDTTTPESSASETATDNNAGGGTSQETTP